MTDRELMTEALEVMMSAINSGDWKVDGACSPHVTIVRLTNRLAQPETEPVLEKPKFWVSTGMGHTKPLYTAPPKREWVGLTDEEVMLVMDDVLEGGGWLDVARAIEAKLKEKNT
jgi:hypothetical protein